MFFALISLILKAENLGIIDMVKKKEEEEDKEDEEERKRGVERRERRNPKGKKRHAPHVPNTQCLVLRRGQQDLRSHRIPYQLLNVLRMTFQLDRISLQKHKSFN